MFRPIARTAAARAASSHCDMDPSCTCVCGITETAKELAEDSNEVHKDAAVELRVREAESGGVMKKKRWLVMYPDRDKSVRGYPSCLLDWRMRFRKLLVSRRLM